MQLSVYCAFFILLLFATSSCIPHRSYVASPYEPVLVEKKGDVQFNAGMRPFKYYSAEATVALTDFMAVRGGVGGFSGLENYSVSFPFFNGRASSFMAPGINYQRNVINGKIPTIFGNNTKNYKYNCEYFSPCLVLGFKIGGGKESQQVILKVQYNFVQKYEYYFEEDNGSGRSSSYQVFDNETLNYPLQNFFSFEPSYSMLYPLNPFLWGKIQLGVSICQTALSHKYSFQQGDYTNPQMVDAVTNHPRTLPFNISIGLLFKGNAARKKAF